MAGVEARNLIARTHREIERRGVPDPPVERVVAGSNLLLVEFASPIEDAFAGVVHSPSDSYPDVVGDRASTIVEAATGPGGTVEDRALAVATLDALSTPFVEWRAGDPMEALRSDVTRIGMVGMFTPAMGKFEALDISVVERFQADVSPPGDLPDGVQVNMFGPDEARSAFTGASVVYITGSTMIYGGIGTYLAAAPDDATVVLIGSSASFVPDVVFEAGVDVLAGVEVIDVGSVADRIAGRTSVPELHGTGLEKGVLIDDEASLSGLDESFVRSQSQVQD